MSTRCGIELDSLPIVATCPDDSETMLFMGTVGGLGDGRYARRRWLQVKNCLQSASKIRIVNGVSFEGNTYNNTALAGLDLIVYYNGVGFLLTSQYVVLETGGFVALFADTFTDADNFVLFPNGVYIAP